MDRRDSPATGPGFLGAGAVGDFQPFLEIRIPHARDVLVVAVDDPAERHAKFVLVARQLDAVFRVRHFLPESVDARQPARGALHERVQVGAEQVEPRIGEAAEVARLQRGTGDDERAAESALVAGLAVAVVGHVLRAGSAHVVLDVFVEDRPGARGEMRHHVFADQAAPVGEALRVRAVRRIEQDARVLRRPRGEHHDARRLELLFLLLVVVLDAGDASALGIGEHARDRAPRAHLGSGLSGVGQIGDQRIGERAGRAADMAPAVVDARRAPLVVGRVHADRRGHHAYADRFEALQPDVAVAEGLHRRHRVGGARRPPDLLGLGVAGDADVARHLVVVRREVLVGDRPVEPAVVLAFHLEVVRQQAREVRKIVQRGSADAPARLVAVPHRVPALQDEWSSCSLDPPSPEIRADQIGEFPVRPLLQHHDLLAGPRQHCGIDRARRTRADDDDIDLFELGHVTTSSRARCAACKGCRGIRNLPPFRRPRRRRRCASRSR